MSSNIENPDPVPVTSPVSQALILVCEKCGKKIAPSPDQNPAKDLQALLKQTIRDTDGKGKLRALITSCMDVCPDGEITVGISWADEAGGKDRFFTVKGTDIASDSVNILEKVLEGP